MKIQTDANIKIKNNGINVQKLSQNMAFNNKIKKFNNRLT